MILRPAMNENSGLAPQTFVFLTRATLVKSKLYIVLHSFIQQKEKKEESYQIKLTHTYLRYTEY